MLQPRRPATRVLSSLAAAGFLAAMAAPAHAANHPERNWLVKDSAHFSLHYYPGIEKTALRILQAAEEAYPKLSADFGVRAAKGRIPIILTQDSFYNGSAEPIKDRITLDPVLANSSVIGTQRFVAHELAHVLTFQAVDKGNKLTQLSSLGGMPTWFLEGIAQYTAEYWYPSNDRMLRLHTLENTLLTTSERANFRLHGVHGGASGYNEGYALCRYMFDTYGKNKLGVFLKHMKAGKHTFEQAIEVTFGQNLAAIEAGWKQSLREGYKKQVAGLAAEIPGATRLVSTYQGEVNVQPRLAPDGKRLAYLTSRYQDSFLYMRGNVMGFLSLYTADPDGRNARAVPGAKGAVNHFAWSPDGKQLAYARVVGDENGNPTFDVYVYDTASHKTSRLTEGEGVHTLAWRPNSRHVSYVAVHDGDNVLKAVDVASKKVTTLAEAPGTLQYREPAWSPDGRRVTLVAFEPGKTGHLVLLDPDTDKTIELTKKQERVADSFPVWTPDGKAVVFTSDRGGMTNLYRIELANRSLTQLTRTYRGAETPSLSPDGKYIYYTSYRSKGSDIFRLPLGKGEAPQANTIKTISAKPAVQREPLKAASLPAEGPKGLTAALPLDTAAAGPLDGAAPAGTTILPKAPSLPDIPAISIKDAKPYQSTLTQDLLVPQMTQDERGQQIGVATLYSDILNKQQLALDIRYGLWSQRFSYLAQYVNRMNTSTWGVSLYDQPQFAISPDIGANGGDVYQNLYFQRQRGALMQLQTPLGGGRSLTSGMNLSRVSTLSDPAIGNYGQLREGQLNSLSLGYSEQNVKQTIDMDINPSEGYRLGMSWVLSDARLGSAFNFSQYMIQGARYFNILPDQRHNLAWTFNLGLINGDAPQPFLLGGTANSNPLYGLRGYAVGAQTGNRLASTGLEYTLPIYTHLDKSFGPLYLDRLYVTGFTDVGAAWNQGVSSSPFASAGAELRLRTALGGQLMTFRFGLAKKLGSSEMPGLYLAF